MQKIFVLENDKEAQEMLLYALQVSGLDSVGFENGANLFDNIKTDMCDLIILESELHLESGFEILENLKSNPDTKEISVIMLSANKSKLDKTKALDLGADDYITKPFSTLEFMLRIKSILRRMSQKNKSFLVHESISLDTQR